MSSMSPSVSPCGDQAIGVQDSTYLASADRPLASPP